MKQFRLFIAMLVMLAVVLSACASSVESITSSANGDVITTIQARGTGGGASFDGTVDTLSDLDDLVSTAWGVARLGLHRGHAPIEGVLEAYLGISHDEMHVLMEDGGMNLAAICENFGFDPENLVETLTASFVPFIEEGVENGVITTDEVEAWTDRVRTEFRNRINWEG